MVKGRSTDSIQFLQAWRPEGPWTLTSIVVEGGKTNTRTFEKTELKEMFDWLNERQGRQNIYFTVNTLSRPMSKKPSKEDIRGMITLHVDIDPRPASPDEDKKKWLKSERERAIRLLSDFKPAPTVIVDSGGGYQGFWLLEEEQRVDGSLERAAELEAYNLQIELLLQADSCHNIDRIMRLPGTVNLPNEKKRKKGREPALAHVVEADWSRTYSLSDFTPAPRVQTEGSSPGVGGGAVVQLSGNIALLDSVDDLPDEVSQRTKMLIVQGSDPDDPTRYPSRSEATWAVLCELVRAGCDDDMIAAVLMDPDFGISGHTLDQPRAQEYAARQIQRAREDAIDPYLRRLNERHAVIEDIGGKCRVISEVMDYALNRPKISRQSFEDFRNRYMHIPVVIGQDKDGKDIHMPLGKWWLLKKERRQYKTIVFAPGREITEAYNLWRGFSCDARPGDCGLFLRHLRENVCRGNEAHYKYLIQWMARGVQRPDSPGEVAIVLRGRMGTGKSFFAKAYGSLWGRHFLQVSDPKHLVGSFNAHLRDCIVLFADEAFYAGDKKHESILKTMVTEETLMIESKGVDAEAAPNYVHMIMASNNDWVVPAGSDERRFFVLDVGDGQMQNKSYFRAIWEELNNGGREALLHLLLTMDISEFDVRAVPQTQALQDQKILSMTTEEVWWYQRLMDGSVVQASNDWDQQVLKERLQSDYLNYCERQKIMRRMSPTALGKFLTKVLPAGFPRSFQRWTELEQYDSTGQPTRRKSRAWFYEMPELDKAREHWDKNFGGPYEWPNSEAEPEPQVPF